MKIINGQIQESQDSKQKKHENKNKNKKYAKVHSNQIPQNQWQRKKKILGTARKKMLYTREQR